MEIRRMTEADVEEVAGLEKRCFSTPWTKEGFLSSLARKETVFLVARKQGLLAGYGGMYVAACDAELVTIGVAQPFRRQGVAGALLEAFKDHCRSRGAGRIFLEVRRSNEGAVALYKKKGFVPAGCRRGFYENPKEDALVMVWEADSNSH